MRAKKRVLLWAGRRVLIYEELNICEGAKQACTRAHGADENLARHLDMVKMRERKRSQEKTACTPPPSTPLYSPSTRAGKKPAAPADMAPSSNRYRHAKLE